MTAVENRPNPYLTELLTAPTSSAATIVALRHLDRHPVEVQIASAVQAAAINADRVAYLTAQLVEARLDRDESATLVKALLLCLGIAAVLLVLVAVA